MEVIYMDKRMIIPDEISLELYLKEISRNEALPADEEARLAVQIRKGDKKALEKLIKANLRFVVSVARNYQNQGLPLGELISEGNLGLIQAAKRFDEKRNFKFISYAVWWIRQAILRALADRSRITRVPLNRIGVIHKVGKTQSRLEQKYRRMPSLEEIANELGINESEIVAIQKIGNRYLSLDTPVQADDSSELIDLLQDEEQELPDSRLMELSIHEGVNRILDTLSEREKKVLKLYFGVGEDTAHTLDEIGRRLQLTRERVRQIKEKAIHRLKISYRNNTLQTLD
ncbi:sigma-70 family RNA polymerase sigma factor [Cellulosispirillum alkaliphilum]|uniref:sigma-70 family RNA polymerase sigma factor n=1 Tax=Cellulosispirillum alkaliphilum TaxID=3039283 RepID=UPI003D6F1C7C